eukprot:SAG31_NODE_49688_length_131_cov_153.031250_1_plen_28_part_01
MDLLIVVSGKDPAWYKSIRYTTYARRSV